MTTLSTWRIALFCLGVSSTAVAAPLFEEQSVIDVQLKGPIDSLVRSKQEPRPVPFTLTTDDVVLDVEVRQRGKSRRRVCQSPPLRLSFESHQAAQTVFAGQGVLKLVTHCLDSDAGERNLLEEYLAYRIFTVLSDVAYRVRLLHIDYLDSDERSNAAPTRRWGFVIEPMDQLAERVNGTPLHLPGVVLGKLDPEQAALVYIFQYMIGNTDWSLVAATGDDECCHNGDLVQVGAGIHYIPYDFDLSGIVNASYAKPDPSVRLRNVRMRRYRGFCMDADTLRSALRRVTSRRTAIFDLVRGTPGLAADEAEDTIEYLQGFFDKAANENKLLGLFARQCIQG